jgi:hypothetical protein
VGKGQEFNIWYVSKSGQKSAEFQDEDSIPVSITSDKVRAANTLGLLEVPKFSNLLNSEN